MSARGKEFAEHWADENIEPNARATDKDVAVATQHLLAAATLAEVQGAEIIDGVGGLPQFVAKRMGVDAPSSNS